MKTTKSQAVLYLYACLLEKGSVEKSEIMDALELSDLTFKRYVSELRSYLMNFSRPEELVYLKKENRYVLRPIRIDF
jgi:hypothetical protein